MALDDAQWLDAESADAVGFAVRRLQAERVAVVVATRVGEGRDFDPAGLGAIDLSGLSREAAGELLALNGMPGEEAAARFHALTGGNPLALLELPRWLGAQEASGGGRLDAPVRLGDHLEAAFAARAEVLGAGANEALLVLAASSTEDAAAIATALGAAGLSPAHLEPGGGRRPHPDQPGGDPLPPPARPLGAVSLRGPLGAPPSPRRTRRRPCRPRSGSGGVAPRSGGDGARRGCRGRAREHRRSERSARGVVRRVNRIRSLGAALPQAVRPCSPPGAWRAAGLARGPGCTRRGARGRCNRGV